MNKTLNIISASAGSGKTHTLTETLLEKIASGELNASELVAVTFTEAGASELKGRIRASLLSAGFYEAAQQVESAYISTIHAFGNRLLKEFAFELGIPLSTRMLNEDEQTQLIRASMIDSDALIQMTENLERYGYKTTPKGNKFVSAEQVFRSQLKFFIDLLRSTGREHVDHDFLMRSVAWLEKQYGPTETARTEEDLARVMHRTVIALLSEFPVCPIEQFGVTGGSPIKEFRESYKALETASKFEPLLSDWALWSKLGKLKVTFRGDGKAPNHDRYKELAGAVVSTANELLAVHPGPLRQSREQLVGLIKGAGQTLNGYSLRKRESKLMDYTDMVASAEKALRDSTNRDQLLESIRMVVVDEFQDTNPIQFAFLWHLIGAGIQSILVGDSKQSIMGFQGADPRLFDALLKHPEADVRSLENNWRSQPALLDIINSFTQGLCGEEGMNTAYQPLGAKAKSSSLIPLHMVVIQDKPKLKKEEGATEEPPKLPSERQWNAQQIAQTLKQKLDSNLQVIDRKSGQSRTIRGSDIAVLCPTNSMLAVYSKALEEQGISVNIERQNWFDSTEIQLCLQLLKLMSNPEDKHARLCLACSEFGQMDLQQALELELVGEGISLPVFETLAQLKYDLSSAPIKTVVETVLEETGLLDMAATWPDGAQARANLLKLIGLAKEFSSAPAETLASAGFYGQGIGTFVGWLHYLKTSRDEDTCPKDSYNNSDAIELTTWHKSKGREWPVVVVCGLDNSPKAYLPSAGIGYLDFSEFAQLIQNSQIEFTPKTDLEAKREYLSEPLRRKAEQIAMRELYVALSRPREQLVLEWLPCHLGGKGKIKKRIQVLQDLCGIKISETSIEIFGNVFDAQVDRISFKYEATRAPTNTLKLDKPAIGRYALDTNTYSGPLTPVQQTPSKSEDMIQTKSLEGDVTVVISTKISEPIELGFHKRANELGTLIHRAIELVLAGRETVETYKRRIETALEQFLTPKQIKEVWIHAHQLGEYLAKEGFGETVAVELPVLGKINDGNVVVGTIDLLASGANGKLVIDHKTDSKLDALNEVWAAHQVQLDKYQKLVPDSEVRLNLVRSGQLISPKVG